MARWLAALLARGHRAARLDSIRRTALPSIALIALAALAAPLAQAEPQLQRIKIATFGAPDLAEVERRYTRWLGYRVRERGRIPRELAASWGAPRVAGRPYILMSAEGWPEVFIRVVRSPPVKGYRPLTTWGWNAIELVVDDPDALHERLRDSPFEVIGEPANLSGYPSIRALQVRGSAQEVLYLASERGDRSKSPLPPPKGFVGRPFIMVVAGPDIQALIDWYTGSFGLQAAPPRQRMVGVLRRAQDLGPEETLPLTTARLGQPGNLIELDGYSGRATARPQRRGELPPGVAMASFTVPSLDALPVQFIAAPAAHGGLAYGGRRAATTRGPAGELVELIEE